MDTKNKQDEGEQGFAEEALRAVMAIELAQQATIRDGELEAKHIVETAQKQAKELQADEKARWQRESQAKLAQHRLETEVEVQALRTQAQAQSQRWANKANANMEQAMKLAVRAILLRNFK
jgi:vacuolar-type H+-ATPase subunit H